MIGTGLVPAGLAAIPCLAALASDTEPVRRCGAIAFAVAAGHGLVGLFAPARQAYAGFNPALAAIDLLGLVLLTGVALKADRHFPLAMAATALVATLTHLLRSVSLFTDPLGYLALVQGSCYAMVAMLVVGALASHRKALPGRSPGANEAEA